MKKNKFYIGILLFSLLIAACGKDDVEPVAQVWKRQNEQAINNLANNPEYTALKIPGGTNFDIYYRVLQKGTGKRLYYNSRAEVHYKGWFVATNSDLKIKAGDVFDKRLFDDGIPFKVALSKDAAGNNFVYPIEGWRIALQYMVEGDKWEIWIPYQLAYGELGEKGIPSYSTLAFEIELLKAYDPNTF